MYAALGERAGEKLLQRGLELLLAAGFDAARDGDLNWLCACGHIKKEGDGGGEIVHVAAAGLVDITPGEEMHVRCLHIDVSLKLPGQIHIECSSDVTGSIVERGNLDESGHAIDGIVSRVPPKRTRASVNRNLWQGVQRKVWMDVTAGSASLESEPRIPRRVPGIASIDRRTPCEDRFVAKAANLEHLLP